MITNAQNCSSLTYYGLCLHPVDLVIISFMTVRTNSNRQPKNVRNFHKCTLAKFYLIIITHAALRCKKLYSEKNWMRKLFAQE